MKRTFFSSIADGVLTLLLSFPASLLFLLGNRLSKPVATVLSICFSLFFSAIVFILSARATKSREDKGRSAKELMRTLNVCTYDEILKIFSSVFNDMGIRAYVEGENKLVIGGATLLFALYPESVSANELHDIVLKNGRNDKKLAIVSSSFTLGAALYAESLGVTLFDAEAVYPLIKDSPFFARQTPKKHEKSKRGDFFDRLFLKKNGVRFILFGLSFFIMAFMVFYPVYYYVAGGAFIITGVILLLFAKPPAQNNKPIDLKAFIEESLDK